MLINKVLIFFLCVLLLACNRPSAHEGGATTGEPQNASLEEQLIRANREVALDEDQQIDDLISRYGWKMNRSETGLRYQVYDSSNGAPVVRGNRVTLRYSVRLIDGGEVYSSEELGVKTFVVGKGTVIAGLEEALLLLKEKDKARLVIPSFLGHGLTGDGDKIPPKATLIYLLEVIYVE